MKIFLFILCIRSIFGTKITFGSKNNFFDPGMVENPYARTIYGTNRTDLIICYEDADVSTKTGLCEIGVLDTVRQNVTFSAEFAYAAPSSDVFETQLVNKNGPMPNVLIGYTSSVEGKSGPGKAQMGLLDVDPIGSTIKYGFPETFNDGDNDQTNIIELERDDSCFAVCYSEGRNDNRGTGCKMGQYDASSLSIKFGERMYELPSYGPTDGMGVSHAIDNATWVICYANSGRSTGECVVAQAPDIDTSEECLDGRIHYSSPVTFNSEGGTDEISIVHVTRYNSSADPRLVLCYVSKGDGACSYILIDMDNTNNPIEIRERTQYAPKDKVDQPSVALIPPSSTLGNTVPYLMICYVDVNNNENKETAGCVFGAVDNANSRVNFETTVSNFEQDGADRIDALYLGGNNMIVCYVDGDESKNRAPCIFGVISLS